MKFSTNIGNYIRTFLLGSSLFIRDDHKTAKINLFFLEILFNLIMNNPNFYTNIYTQVNFQQLKEFAVVSFLVKHFFQLIKILKFIFVGLKNIISLILNPIKNKIYQRKCHLQTNQIKTKKSYYKYTKIAIYDTFKEAKDRFDLPIENQLYVYR